MTLVWAWPANGNRTKPATANKLAAFTDTYCFTRIAVLPQTPLYSLIEKGACQKHGYFLPGQVGVGAELGGRAPASHPQLIHFLDVGELRKAGRHIREKWGRRIRKFIPEQRFEFAPDNQHRRVHAGDRAGRTISGSRASMRKPEVGQLLDIRKKRGRSGHIREIRDGRISEGVAQHRSYDQSR